MDGSGNPWGYFVGTLSNVDVRVTDSERYTVKFDSNGGSGDISIRKDETKALPANLYENDGYIFDGWNTKADGSGIDYTNEQSVKNLTKTENDIIDLYAIWVSTSDTYSNDFNE